MFDSLAIRQTVRFFLCGDVVVVVEEAVQHGLDFVGGFVYGEVLGVGVFRQLLVKDGFFVCRRSAGLLPPAASHFCAPAPEPGVLEARIAVVRRRESVGRCGAVEYILGFQPALDVVFGGLLLFGRLRRRLFGGGGSCVR